MTPAEAWAIAHRRLAQAGQDLPASGLFVADEDIDYGQPQGVLVRWSTVFELDAEPWISLLEPSPTWIHFNLLGIEEGRSVVSVCRSRAWLDPEDPRPPSVNVSIEGRALLLVERDTAE